MQYVTCRAAPRHVTSRDVWYLIGGACEIEGACATSACGQCVRMTGMLIRIGRYPPFTPGIPAVCHPALVQGAGPCESPSCQLDGLAVTQPIHKESIHKESGNSGFNPSRFIC